MAEPEVRWLGDLQRVEARPGDVFVLKARGRISLEQREHIRDMWAEMMGPDVKCLVLDDGMDIGVFSQLSAEAQANGVTTSYVTKANTEGQV